VGPGGTPTFGDELILAGGVVDVCEGFFVWAEIVGGFRGAAGEEVTADEREIGQEFTDFGVGEDKGEDGTKMTDGYVANSSDDVII
jgi:hypothetical protein